MYIFQIILVLVLAGFVLLNIIAYKHAHAMLHFTDAGTRTKQPESMSLLQKANLLYAGVNIPRPENNTNPSDVSLEYTTHRFRVSEDVEIEGWHVPCQQSKDLVLLFHGYSASKSSLLNVAKIFNDVGYSTFMIDFRGSGGSDKNCSSIGFYEADDVIKTVEYTRTNFPGTHVILYGQSMGGAAILRAISAKELKPDMIIIEGVFDRMLTTVKARFAAMRIPTFPSAQLLTFWGGQQMGFSAFKHNPSDYASDVDCPVLMLHGEQDPRATIDQATAIFSNLKDPKKLERFIDVGHDACYDAAPEKWKQVVSDYLDQHIEQTANEEHDS